jgi:hypothetical protein
MENGSVMVGRIRVAGIYGIFLECRFPCKFRGTCNGDTPTGAVWLWKVEINVVSVFTVK